MTFYFEDSREGGVRVDVAFTDSTFDLLAAGPELADEVARVEEACGVDVVGMRQVHGDAVAFVDASSPASAEAPTADGLVTTTRGLALMVRVADCVPVLLADVDVGVVGAVHAGRHGMVLDVATRAVEQMRGRGATEITAWVGPRVCAACYEVPEEMRAEVAALVPAAYAVSRTGTPALDVGAGVTSQLVAAGVEVVDVAGCTREDPGLHSYRRDGVEAGRFAGLVWIS